jgi:hypothetical protein
MTVARLIRRPSAFLPLVLSLAALALVIGFVLTHDAFRSPTKAPRSASSSCSS